MSNSQDINYALISALYANKTSGLYSDVYFPIIKYAVVQLFNTKGEGARYFMTQDVEEFISGRFGISIPGIVITKSLVKMGETMPSFVDLRLIDHGEAFSITRLWDSQEFDDMAERESVFSEGLDEIEADYRHYLEENGIYDDSVSYAQFISDNTEEVLGYFQNRDVSVIDEKYTTIVFFLDYLHKTPGKSNEFDIANQLFWASIIAGYLKSEKPPVAAANEGCIKEYFLDTSILLGILNLSCPHKEKYAAEICEIIKASCGVMRIHPITMEEIRYILESVESAAGPAPGTDIAEAWENHKLSITKLASIRINLQKVLKDKGVTLFPILGPDECRAITKQYKGKSVVEQLALSRSAKPSIYGHDNFREIHDLFMDDFIKDRRKAMKDSEDIVFVTANRELITFTESMHPGKSYMISAGQVVLDLWMHSAVPAAISGCALTEVMARCLDQHNARVRNKIAEVSRFFNENNGNFDPQVYRDFIKKLYKRARNVILAVEAKTDDQNASGGLKFQRILDAVKADRDYIEERVELSNTTIAELEDRLRAANEVKESLQRIEQEHEDSIISLRKEIEKLGGMVSVAHEQIKKMDADHRASEVRINLYEKKDKLRTDIDDVNKELDKWELLRDRAFSNWAPVCFLLFGGLFALGGLVVAAWAIVNNTYGFLGISGVLIPFAIFFFNHSISLNNRKTERQRIAFQKWGSRPENVSYRELVRKKEQLEDDLKKVVEALDAEGGTD